MAQWNSTNLSILPISTQTDADSPVSQALMDKLRLFSEQLLVMGYQTGSSCNINTINTTGAPTILTASSSGASDGEHTGRTILITTGLAKGFMYTIDATSSSTGANYKLTMTGDDLYADGVRDSDAYKILYDQLTNTDGHDHDGTNSAIIPGNASLVSVFGSSMYCYNAAPAWSAFRIDPGTSEILGSELMGNYIHYAWKPPGYNTLNIAVALKKNSAKGQVRMTLGAQTVTTTSPSSVYGAWTTNLNVSAVSSGWNLFKFEGYSTVLVTPISAKYLAVVLTPGEP